MFAPPFAAPQTFAAGPEAFAVAVGDFTGDGRLDIAVTNHGPSLSHTVTILVNTMPLGAGVASFAPARSFEAGAMPAGLATGDFNADGRLDLIVANQSGTVSVVLNTTPAGATAPTFAAPQAHAAGPRPQAVTVADFDGNGSPDVAVANEFAAPAEALAVLLNSTVPGAFTVTFGGDAGYRAGRGQTAVVAADFNGDGAADLATADGTDGTVSVLRIQQFAGGYSAGEAMALGVGSSPTGLAAGDFTGDGLPDLVTANAGYGTVSVLVNTSTSGLSPAVVGRTGYGSVQAAFGSPAPSNSDENWTVLQSPSVRSVAATPTGGVVFSQPFEYPYEGGKITPGAIWHFSPTGGWRQLASGVFAVSALAIDPRGNVWAAFAGAGVAVYRRTTGTWDGLPGITAEATLLAVSANGDVFANFLGLGVYRYRSITGWEQINGHEATSLNVDANGSVVANFAGFGLGQYIPYARGWRLLSPTTASAVTVDASGAVFASLDGGGISRWSPITSTWGIVAASAPATNLATDLLGNIYLTSDGFGVWKFAPGLGWNQLKANDYRLPGVSTLGVFNTQSLYGPHEIFAPPYSIPLVGGNTG